MSEILDIEAVLDAKDHYIIFKASQEILLQRKDSAVKTWISDEPFNEHEKLVCALCRLILRITDN